MDVKDTGPWHKGDKQPMSNRVQQRQPATVTEQETKRIKRRTDKIK